MSDTNPINASSAEATPWLRFKAFVLLLVLAVLLIGSTTYILYARGVFEQTQRLVLFTDDAEGVAVGMNMTFAGFELGRVTRISLGDDGNARLDVDIPTSNAKWLRASSVFTLERGLVGGSKIKAFTGVLEDDPLPDNAQRTLLRGDASAQIPFIAAAAKDLIDELRGLVAKTAGEQGALGVMMGNEVDRANVIKLLAQTQQLMGSVDSVARNADRQVFGRGGLVPQGTQTLAQAEQTLAQTTQMLKEVRASLQRVDGVLQDAQAISASAKEASVDLVSLRTEVEGSLRQVNSLMATLQTTWPLGSAPQPVQLP